MSETARLSAALSTRYAIERELGAGGMATVYLAKDLRHEREVALKVLRPDLTVVLGVDRFLQEIRITARLDHPHILTLLDSGESDGFLWYVLPYVRGESLRARLVRERQLGLEEALAITRQIASALDYAHRQGVIHRDIKPENILLFEGEAMLADFGIALAVTQAAGRRLTESGLSLGTPQYMSPEQASGDRALDGRSDVYSLAAVLYEMLAGEPPHSGPTAQAIIAKLLAERPTRLRTLRDTVPEGIDNAVAKALAKAPVDRFTDAGTFARTLGGASTPSATPRRVDRRLISWLVLTGVATIAALGIWIEKARRGGERGPSAMLRDRTQLTFTGKVRWPAISGDGKQLAYITPRCGVNSCAYSVEIQDVGGTATRRVLEGATSAALLWWSPDRRNLMFEGTIGRRWGHYLLPTLGGAPRYVVPNGTAWWAGGDSLIVAPPPVPDSVFWLQVQGLDGSVRDSIRLGRPGLGVYLEVIPGSPWILALVEQTQAVWNYVIIDRQGRIRDEMLLGAGPARGSSDAVWVLLGQYWPHTAWPLVRMPLDARTGRFSGLVDTVYMGTPSGFDVTADGSTLALGEGTWESSIWTLSVTEALRGSFPLDRRVLKASTGVLGFIAPDGRRLLLWRQAGAAAPGESRLSVMPFSGGPEAPIPLFGRLVDVLWADSLTVALAEQVDGRFRLSLVDVKTHTRRAALATPDSLPSFGPHAFAPLGTGAWAWVSADGRRVRVQAAEDQSPRDIIVPQWYQNIYSMQATPDNGGLAYLGWNTTTSDSVRVSVFSFADSSTTPWATVFAPAGAWFSFLRDRSLLLFVRETQENVTLYRLRAPGRMEHLGFIPRPVQFLSVSDDMRQAVVAVNDYHGDAWMYRVVRP